MCLLFKSSLRKQYRALQSVAKSEGARKGIRATAHKLIRNRNFLYRETDRDRDRDRDRQTDRQTDNE